MKVQVYKTTANGEQINVEFNVPTDKGLVQYDRAQNHLEVAFRLIDERLVVMNHRVIAASNLCKTLTPEQNLLVRQVLDTLHGGPMAVAPSEAAGAALDPKVEPDAPAQDEAAVV